MAQSDVNLIFSSGQAITATAASTGYYDAAEGLMLTGNYTNPLTDQVWGTAAVFGSELGVGDEKLPFLVYTGSTAWTTGTSVNIAIQCAVDPNSGNTRGGLTFVTAIESGAIITSLLTAYTKIWAPWWPHRAAFAAATNGSVPRFYQINYTVAGSNFATAAVTAAVAQTRDDNPGIYYGPGFTVGA